MRSPTSGLNAALTTSGSQPCYLVQITFVRNPAQPRIFQLTDLDRDFLYNGITWQSTDLEVRDLSWGVGAAGTLVLGDADMAWWFYALTYEIQDASVYVWQAYADASNEAEPLWNGRIGGVRKTGPAIECQLFVDRSLTSSPRRRVQHIVDTQYLVPAGKVILIGNQKWVLERKSNS